MGALRRKDVSPVLALSPAPQSHRRPRHTEGLGPVPVRQQILPVVPQPGAAFRTSETSTAASIGAPSFGSELAAALGTVADTAASSATRAQWRPIPHVTFISAASSQATRRIQDLVRWAGSR
jgi:hypothetical protein